MSQLTGLYRAPNDADLYWHSVGGIYHQRGSFNLVDIAAYAPKDNSYDRPPFHIYQPNTPRACKFSIPENSYATIPAAKRAARKWAIGWIGRCDESIAWADMGTGRHFEAIAGTSHGQGVHVGQYYFNQDKAKGPIGFRVWFGGTYYLTDFKDVHAAKLAVEATWRTWISIAKRRFCA